MLTIVLVVLAVLVAAVLIAAAMRPPTFRVERSTVIAAPPERVYPFINDFHRWPAWSPWEKMDPSMQRTYSGADQGKGTVYGWEGNKKVGQGRMEITDTVPSSKVVIKLDFLKPFEAHNTTEFTLSPQGGATKVNWAMHGPHPFFFRLMAMLCNMDKMVGKDFEAGLANMKAAVEQA